MPPRDIRRGSFITGAAYPAEPIRKTITREKIEAAQANGRKIFLTSDGGRTSTAVPRALQHYTLAIAEMTARLQHARRLLEAPLRKR